MDGGWPPSWPDVTSRFAIPTTTPTRTLFDLASNVSPRELRSLFERSEYLEVLDRPRLRALLADATGRSGLGTLRDLLGFRPLPLAETRSRLERIVLGICLSVVRNRPIEGARGYGVFRL